MVLLFKKKRWSLFEENLSVALATNGEIMNYVEIGIWAITGIAVVLSVLLGMMRGARRAVLRLILVLVCVVAAFCLKDFVTNTLLTTEIAMGETTTTIQEYVLTSLPEEVSSLGESVVIPLIRIIVGVVIFLVLFWARKLVSWIILYPICKIFVKKGAKKHAGIGALTGLVQGVVIALCFCVPISGMLVQVNRVISMMEDLQGSTASASTDDKYAFAAEEGSVSSGTTSPEGEGGSTSESGEIISDEIKQILLGYEETIIGKFYGHTCSPIFDLISGVQVPQEDGTNQKMTLSGQIDAIKAMLDILQQFNETTEKLNDIDFSDLSSFSELREAFGKLDEITAELPQEAKNTINAVVSSAIDMVPVPDDAAPGVAEMVTGIKDTLKSTDFTEIKFTKELDVIENITATIEKGENVTVDDIAATIDSVSESALLVPVLSNVNTDLDLPNGTKMKLEEVFDELPDDTDQETVDVLKNILGLSTGE